MVRVKGTWTPVSLQRTRSPQVRWMHLLVHRNDQISSGFQTISFSVSFEVFVTRSRAVLWSVWEPSCKVFRNVEVCHATRLEMARIPSFIFNNKIWSFSVWMIANFIICTGCSNRSNNIRNELKTLIIRATMLSDWNCLLIFYTCKYYIILMLPQLRKIYGILIMFAREHASLFIHKLLALV